MRKSTKIIPALAMTAATIAATAMASAPAAKAIPADPPWWNHNCPSGWVCTYESASDWSKGKIDHKYYTYGVHKLYGQYGKHVIYNHQTGGAKVSLNRYSGGGSVAHRISAGYYKTYDLTPINSITLYD